MRLMPADQLTNEVVRDYLAALPHVNIPHAKCLILFSGVPGSGKSTVAITLEKELSGIRISNDQIRDRISARDPVIAPKVREDVKLAVVTELLKQLATMPNGLVIVDASCDRGYDYYASWAQEHGYRIYILRMVIPRETIEQRIKQRGNEGYRVVVDELASLDGWRKQWEAFGTKHKADLLVTENTTLAAVLRSVTDML